MRVDPLPFQVISVGGNGAASLFDVARVPAGVMPEVAGRADGSAAGQLVREKLA
jgi:uncharacterized protein YqeY